MSRNSNFRGTSNGSNNPNQIPSMGTKPVKRSAFNEQSKGSSATRTSASNQSNPPKRSS